MKFYLIYMVEISEAETRWILEMKFASYGGVKDLRNIFVIMENRSSPGTIVSL